VCVPDARKLNNIRAVILEFFSSQTCLVSVVVFVFLGIHNSMTYRRCRFPVRRFQTNKQTKKKKKNHQVRGDADLLDGHWRGTDGRQVRWSRSVAVSAVPAMLGVQRRLSWLHVVEQRLRLVRCVANLRRHRKPAVRRAVDDLPYDDCVFNFSSSRRRSSQITGFCFVLLFSMQHVPIVLDLHGVFRWYLRLV
jgi:hypothetical protein